MNPSKLAQVEHPSDITAHYEEAQLAFERTVRELSGHTNKTLESKFDYRNIALRRALAERLLNITRQMEAADTGRITWAKAVERIAAIFPGGHPRWADRYPKKVA